MPCTPLEPRLKKASCPVAFWLWTADAIRDKVSAANKDQHIGVSIALRAMEEPFRQIVANAGVEPSVVLNRVRQSEGSYGYNAKTEEFGDVLESGIIDQAKVTSSVL